EVVDPLAEDLRAVVLSATDGHGVDVAFESVGAAAALESALALPRKSGTVVVIGVAPESSTVTIRPYELFSRELTIRGSAMPASESRRAGALLGPLDLEPLLRYRVPLAHIEEAFAAGRKRAAPKVLVCP